MNIFLFIILSFTYTHMTLSIFIITPPAVATKVFILKKKDTHHANGADHMHAGSGFYSCSHFTMLRPAVLSSETERHRQRSSEAAPPVCIACMHASLHSCKTSRRRLGRRARRAAHAWRLARRRRRRRTCGVEIELDRETYACGHACAAAVHTWGSPMANHQASNRQPVIRGTCPPLLSGIINY